jgi:hypothetical protein
MKSFAREELINAIASFINATDNNEIINFIFDTKCLDEEIKSFLLDNSRA